MGARRRAAHPPDTPVGSPGPRSATTCGPTGGSWARSSGGSPAARRAGFASDVAAPLGLRLVDRPARGDRATGRRASSPPEASDDPEVRALMDRGHGAGDDARRRAHRAVGSLPLRRHVEHPRLHECELPSSNGILSAHTVARACTPHSSGRWTATGCSPRRRSPRRHDHADRGHRPRHRHADALRTRLHARRCELHAASPPRVGHSGAGGSLGLADPEHHIGFGYVMNRMQVGLVEDKRPRNLLHAVYSALRV